MHTISLARPLEASTLFLEAPATIIYMFSQASMLFPYHPIVLALPTM